MNPALCRPVAVLSEVSKRIVEASGLYWTSAVLVLLHNNAGG